MVRTTRRIALAALAAMGVMGPGADALTAQPVDDVAWQARIWVDQGEQPVVNRGDRVRVYYRTALDSYTAIFHIDTNGAVRLLFPSSPDTDHFVEGGRDYRLLFPRSSAWLVDEDPGVGYFFILASPQPLDFRDFRYSWGTREWDLSFVGRRVADDPFVAMDEYIARLIPEWEYAEYGLDWVEYNVGEQHDYPRFLCYDCHGFSPYNVWNPYLSACTSFRVVIYDDPWYYPAYRYGGTSVVWVRPPVWQQPRYTFRTRVVGEPLTPLVRPRPSGGGLPGVPGSTVQRRTGSGIGSGGTARPTVTRPGTRPGSSAPTRTRPSQAVPTRRSGASGGTPGAAGSGTGVIRRGTPSQVQPNRRGGAATRSTPTTRGTATDRRAPTTRTTPTTRNSSGTRTTPTVRGMPTTKPGATTRTRPVLQRRPPASGSSGSSGTVRGVPRTRPTGTARPGSSGSGSTSGAQARPSRSSGSTSRTPARTQVRIPPRSSGGASRSVPRPSTRSSGGATRSRPMPSTRSSGGATRSRIPPSTRSGTVRRAPARSSGGSARPRSSGARTSRPPVTRRPPGGGGLF